MALTMKGNWAYECTTKDKLVVQGTVKTSSWPTRSVVTFGYVSFMAVTHDIACKKGYIVIVPEVVMESVAESSIHWFNSFVGQGSRCNL